MRISVIIPTFNRVETLARALDSVLAQTLSEEIEVIVVDDGSTDSTAELIASYSDVCYLSQENRGVSAARNAGLAAASGEWIALLDSDDEWLPEKLDRQTSALRQSGLKVCHTEEVWVRNGVRVNQMQKHQKQGGWIFEQCLSLCAMSPSSIMIHRSIFDEFGGFDETLPACEDYDLWLRICAQYQVEFIAEPCIKKYGGHADQLSRQHWGMDRFRVLALEKLLISGANLTMPMIEAATNMLLQKTNILLMGARKRDNQPLIALCEQRLSRWGSPNSD